MAARILLVEDDDDLREVMSAALEADGHAVVPAADGHAALEALADAEHDLVLLDLGLGPGPDGIEVCRRLRRVDAATYVLVLTARDGEADVVLALEAGADDHVTKPIGIVELRSRVAAALRRIAPAPAGPEPELLRHAELTLDPAVRTLHVGADPVELTHSEFAVLEALLRANGAVRSRAELLQAIFGDDAYRDPRGVDYHVHHLREKLTQAGGSGERLATVRGAGYRLTR